MTSESDVDRQARELYEPRRRDECGAWLTLADELQGACPGCGAPLLAGPDVTGERAAAMLAELRRRRLALGLDVHHA